MTDGGHGLSYSRLIAVGEVRDAGALAALAWQVYGLLATTAADLDALRERHTVQLL